MKKMLKIITLSFLLVFTQSIANAELPAYLDFKFILNNSEAGKKAQTTLKKKT